MKSKEETTEFLYKYVLSRLLRQLSFKVSTPVTDAAASSMTMASRPMLGAGLVVVVLMLCTIADHIGSPLRTSP
jgi:hypothetical protein